MTRLLTGLRFVLVPVVAFLATCTPAQAVPLTPFPDGGTLQGETMRFRPAFFDIFVEDPVLSWLPAVETAVPGGSFFDVFVTLDFEMCALGACNTGSATGQATAFVSELQNPDGSFQTEMVAMDLMGAGPPAVGPFRLRESPTRASRGAVALNGLPPGNPRRIDSFFDIFTELSIDDGQTWLPSMGDGVEPFESSDRFSSPAPIPEPSTLMLAGAGFLLVASRLRRARQT